MDSTTKMQESTLPPNSEFLSESSERPLAYVETIQSLRPIEGADVIEMATVRGWNVVVKKGLYKPQDPVIYCEIDSVLPSWEYFTNDKLDKVNYRIKTMKLRGRISQGYCVPLKVLETHPQRKLQLEIQHDGVTTKQPVHFIRDLEKDEQIRLDVGTDVTALLGVKKYELPDTRVGVFKGNKLPFPGFLHKSDQQRIQNLPDYPLVHADVEFEVTEKMDGTSITAFVFQRQEGEQQFGICSRNFELDLLNSEQEAEKVKELLLHQMGVKDALCKYGKNVALQGELIGPGIQGNTYKLTSHRWMIYDVWLIDQCRYATPKERISILTDLGFHDKHSVPILHNAQKIGGMSVDGLIAMAEGDSVLKKGLRREGLVFKATQLKDNWVVSFKAISNAFLLKKEA